MSESTQNTTQPKINRFYLRHLRENVAKLTREQLAAAINVETELVTKWENGRTQPNQKHQLALERRFGIQAGSLHLEMPHLLGQDFRAAYFGDASARARIEWADEKRKFAQTLDILPPTPNKRSV